MEGQDLVWDRADFESCASQPAFTRFSGALQAHDRLVRGRGGMANASWRHAEHALESPAQCHLGPVAETLYANNGAELAGNVSLLSEVRAAGAALLASGLLVISGALLQRLTFTSTLVAALLYLSYGLCRILSMAIDGLPAEGHLQAADPDRAATPFWNLQTRH